MVPSGSVLIVDDDPVIQQLMVAALKEQGYRVAMVGTGEQALAEAKAQLPDLILLDVLLPDIHGMEVCRLLRAEPSLAEVPVIMITALHDAEARLQSLHAGADDFITKPVDFLELRARVASILRLNRYRRLLEERVQRQRAEEEILRRNRDLSLLNEFIVATAVQLRQASQIDRALEEACRVLVDGLDLMAASVQLQPKYMANPLNQTFSAQVLHPSLSPRFLSQELTAALTLPFRIKDQVEGSMDLYVAHGRTFAPHERALVESLVGALTQAIETVLLNQQLQYHVNSLEMIVTTRTYELQVERDRTQAILEALGEAVIVTDADGIISYANPAATELTGHSPQDLLGQAWQVIQGNSDGDGTALEQQIHDHIATGHVWRGDIRGVRRDESSYDMALTVAPLFDLHHKGELAGMVSIQRDITLVKAAERMKAHFISNVSHELRTPLSIIALHSGNLDTLYHRLDDERRRQLIREIRFQTGLLDDLIGDVLELSRVDSGQLPLQRRPLDLGLLLRHEAERMQPLAQRKHLRLEVQACEGIIVQGDEGQLQQCMRNLISNAIKYTKDGGTIRCECALLAPASGEHEGWPGFERREGGRYAGLRIIDSGVGIAAEHLPHLFERFYRVENQGKIPGTGLGLAITRELVGRHGGWTGVASTPGVGSTFAFYVPSEGSVHP
ncbi:MAG: hybrid sensor histidine kinase/response regulator [Candidatus Viridilinea halotolerans]|uniref:histidine kinase n=1 Tax=Candidatus Viridilinea halotolerans TaxID=2491704 RepID=A0A426U8S9_9CHLR|nr:MAG: hybrid sensor histidine kinase/response regulator [Candidatus Viridilinea halotolerans]